MKRILYLIFMVWIALQSALVQAHSVKESLHQLSHFVQVSDQSFDKAVADADQGDSCTVLICSHPVLACYSISKFSLAKSSSWYPSLPRLLEFDHEVDDIERPKWLNPAFGVAGI